MLRAINTWDDYRAKLREFDAVLEHGKAVSAALDGQPLSSSHASYGEQIFAKLLSHCIVLRSLAPDPNHGAPRELWDVSTMSAVARCVVEAHDAFEYIAGHDVTDSERAFRIMLWELHDQSRRLKMLVASGSELRRVETIRADALRLQAALERHDFFHNLPAHLQAELQRRMTKGDTPAFHLNPRRRCAMRTP